MLISEHMRNSIKILKHLINAYIHIYIYPYAISHRLTTVTFTYNGDKMVLAAYAVLANFYH